MNRLKYLSLALIPLLATAHDINSDFTHAINKSSLDLFVKLHKKRQPRSHNFGFFTPNMLATFGMLAAGAPESAKGALEDFLGVNDVSGNYYTSFGQWLLSLKERSVPFSADLTQASDKFFFRQAQGLMTLKGISIPQATQTRLNGFNPAHIVFNSVQEAKDLTNAWVETETEGKIKNLVESLPEETVLMLATAALFQGQWKHPFKPEKNCEEIFFNADGTQSPFTMMKATPKSVRIYSDEDNDIALCELPFHGDISMLIVKQANPYPCSGFKAAQTLSTFMTSERLLPLLEQFDTLCYTSHRLNIGIPKLDYKDKADIFGELYDEPLIQAITGANWTGSLLEHSRPTYTKQLISEVQFQVDESGAQVAAATYVPIMNLCYSPGFQVNVPFALILWDNRTKTILGLAQFFNL